MTDSLAGLILAAGLSRRMGTPKMLLPWGDRTVLGQVLTTFHQAGLARILVVTGGEHQAVEAEVRRLAWEVDIECVFNPQYETGEMLSSIQCGLAALGGQVPAALIGLGDQPQLSLETVRRLIAAYNAEPERIIVPSYQFHRGHPWLVSRAEWGQIMALKPPQTMRDFFTAHDGEIRHVEADSTIIKDLDTPDDYLRDKP
jgi:molybdenum cofactor cytidylyltransferase